VSGDGEVPAADSRRARAWEYQRVGANPFGGLGAAAGLPQVADGARHGPGMAVTAALCLPARASKGAGAGRSAEQEGVAGWLTRVLGLLLAHTGAWFAMGAGKC